MPALDHRSVPRSLAMPGSLIRGKGPGTPVTASPADERSLDWRYFFALGPASTALLLGRGLESEARALSEVCAVVHLPDPDPDRLGAAAGPFDLVALGGSRKAGERTVPFGRLVHRVRHLLRPGGDLVVNVNNALSPLGTVGRRADTAMGVLRTYERALRSAGFVDVRPYAPLPWPDAPLFYVPLDDPRALRFFFRDLFDLMAAVSPEVRQRYRVPFAVARAGRSLVLLLRIERIARIVVPTFSVFARRPGDDGPPRRH